MTNTRARIGWDNVFRTGVVVDLDIGVWRALASTKKQDLGIENSPEVNKVLSMGSMRLVPKKAFEKIHEIGAEAKRDVEYHSLTFPFVRGARFVPDAKLPVLVELMKAKRAQFDAEADAICAGLEEIRDAQLPDIKKALQDAAKTPEAAAIAYERMLAEYPEGKEVRKKFFLRWNVYAIRGASGAAAEVAEQEAESVKSIVRDMIGQLRQEFTEKVGAVMGAVAKGGRIPAPTIESAREVLQRVRTMNVFGDSVLEQQVAVLERVLAEAERGKVYSSAGNKMVMDLVGVQKAIEASAEQAVKEAEASLTGVGKRKIDVAKGAAA
jgi:hypothetical protein